MAGERVVIIGGGISGLCSALALQKKGIHVEVFDQDEPLSESEPGIILGGNALNALNYFGVGAKIMKSGILSDNCTIYSELGKIIADLTYSSPTTASKFLSIHPRDFYRIITDSLNPGTVHHSKKLVDFTQTEDNIELTFSDGETIISDYVLSCDGQHSFIRSRLLPSTELEFTEFASWHGILDCREDMDRPKFSETWGPRGLFGIAPLPDDRVYWYAIKNRNHNDKSLDQWVTLDLVFNFFSYHDPIQSILERTIDANIVYKDLYELKPLQQYLYGRVLLLGDSAHVAPVNLGQGPSQAIEDALYLAKSIIPGTLLIDSFKKYQQERLKRARQVSTDMKLLLSVAQLDKPALCAIRNNFLKLIPASFHQKKLKGIFEIESFGYN